jgi:hypothetical protein
MSPMLKPLTLSLSLAFALGASSVSMAGGLFHGGGSGCSTCGLASPQGAPSAQAAPVASAQCDTGCGGGGGLCGGKKLFSGFHGWTHKPKCYTYEWVLKKKRVWGHHGGGGCDTCGGVYPSAQGGVASPQAIAAPQTYGSGQISYGAPQATTAVEAAPAPAGDEAPPAPAAPAAPAAPEAPAAPAPPAPAAPAPAAPAAPAPPTANAPQSSLLFSTPAGN